MTDRLEIDLNADLGEGAGFDPELLRLVTSANVSCGAHAGDPDGLRHTLELAGEFGFTIENPLLVLPHIRAGKLRPLAVTSRQRTPLLPDVPTMAEAGLEGFEAGGWYGLVAPAGIPAEIIAQLHTETVAALKEPEMARRITDMASPNITSTPDEFRAFIAAETQKWRSVLQAAKPAPR